MTPYELDRPTLRVGGRGFLKDKTLELRIDRIRTCLVQGTGDRFIPVKWSKTTTQQGLQFGPK